MHAAYHLRVTICSVLIGPGEKRRSLGRDYHPLCLKCKSCKRQLTAGQHAEVETHQSYIYIVYIQIQIRENLKYKVHVLLSLFQHDEKPYCTNCYMLEFGPKVLFVIPIVIQIHTNTERRLTHTHACAHTHALTHAHTHTHKH